MKTIFIPQESPQTPIQEGNIVVRRTKYVYFFRLIIATSLYISSILILMITATLWAQSENEPILVIYTGFLIFLTIPIFFLAIVYIYLRWLRHMYIIMPTAIIERKGVFYKTEDNYACNRIEAVQVTQSLLGQMFNFGTIALFDPFLERNIYLRLIGNPNVYADVLRQHYVTTTSQDVRVVQAPSPQKTKP